MAILDRERIIIRTSVVGILGNLVLVAFKLAVGFAADSIAVILDAVNNLSDALSSVITIVGTRLAGKNPDKKHPYGYGRIEYITSVLIAVIVLIAGLTSLRESVLKIVHPVAADYSAISLVIIAAAVAVKLAMGQYVKRMGKKVSSGALVASGADALFDAILSLSTLAAAAVSLVWGLTPEGWLGAVISAFIIKSGVEMLLDTLNSIIGTRAEKDLTRSLRELVAGYEGVLGVYDITLHNYGPTQIIGSAHIEVADDMTAREIHALSRRIVAAVYGSLGVVLTLGVYASNQTDTELAPVKVFLAELVRTRPEILEIHALYRVGSQVSFDMIVDFRQDASAVRAQVLEKLAAAFPDYAFSIVLDRDYSD